MMAAAGMLIVDVGNDFQRAVPHTTGDEALQH